MPTAAAARRLVYTPLADLEPAPRNPKRHDDDGIGRSIDRFGFVEPIVVDERTGRLVAGHGRLNRLRADHAAGKPAPEGVKVLRDGSWQVPVTRGWASRSDAEAEAYLAASNRLVELGGWDEPELGQLLADITAVDPDLAAIAGFDASETARLLARAQGAPARNTDPNDAPSLPTNPVTQPGDVWLLGPHRLVCGDATDPAVVEQVMAGGLADLIWTDPPYGVAIVGGTAEALTIRNDDLPPDQLGSLLAGAFANAAKYCRPGASWYVAAGDRTGPFQEFLRTLTDLGVYRHLLVWVKDRFVLSAGDYHFRHEVLLYGWLPGARHHAVKDRTQDTVWEVPRPTRSSEHPTMKPVELVVRSIDNSTRHGAVVLDLFGGSGTTLIAAHTTGRLARLVELAPGYCDVICHRWEAHTGVAPILEATGETHRFAEATDG